MAASDPDVVRARHTLRSSSSRRRHSPNRSDSNSPFKRDGGLLSVLRQKFSARVSRSRDASDVAVSRHHSSNADTPVSSATLCSSWRSRPRHIDKPIRPAYSDECLSCCGRTMSLRVRTHHHHHRQQAPTQEFAKSFEPQQAVASTSRRVTGIVLCKHCHSKNDQSPSDFELSERELSQSEEEKVRDMLPVDREYGHAMAPNTSSVTVTCDVITIHSSPRDCSTLLASSSGGLPSCSTVTASLGNQSACATAIVQIESRLVPPMQPFYDQVKEAPKGWSLSKELFKLSKHGWYWGPITRVEAEEKLAGQADGAFLVRDSSDDRYLLSLSFRSFGRTLHTRIEHCNGVFSFYAQPESEGYSSIIDLIEHSMTDSQSGVFCYSRARLPGSPSFPVRLARPVSRFAQVRTLQYLCRFCIRQYTRVDHIQQLPLPTSIKGWLEEGQY